MEGAKPSKALEQARKDGAKRLEILKSVCIEGGTRAMDLLDTMAHAVMKAAGDEAYCNEEPKYAIERFDSWVDCRVLVEVALEAQREYQLARTGPPKKKPSKYKCSKCRDTGRVKWTDYSNGQGLDIEREDECTYCIEDLA